MKHSPCKFLNEAISKNNKNPALIMFSRGYLIKQMGFDCLAYNDTASSIALDLSMFQRSQCYFLKKDVSYNLKELNEHFNQHTLMYHDVQKNHDVTTHDNYLANFIGFPTTYNDKTERLHFGQFGYSYKDEKLRSYLLFHKTFYDHIDMKAPSMEFYNEFTYEDRKHEIIVNGEMYYWILFNMNYKIDGEVSKITPQWHHYNNLIKHSKKDEKSVSSIEVTKIKAQINIPNIFKVKCSNVKSVMNNGSLCKDIATLPLSKSEVGKYVYKNFQNLENFDLEELKPEFLKIELTDEFDCTLRLQSGHPTLVKMHLNSSDMNTTIFRVSSHYSSLFPANVNNKFTVKLPNKLTFLGKEPKMSVSSIMLWNWPCYLSDYDFFYRVIDSEGTHNFWVQNPIRDHDDMIMQISNNLKKWIKMETLTNGHMLIEAKTEVSLTLGKHLAFIFGLSDEIPTSYATFKLESSKNTLSNILDKISHYFQILFYFIVMQLSQA